MAGILQALRRLREGPARVLSMAHIRRVSRGLGHHSRERVLGPAETVLAMITQAAHGNTSLTHLVRLCHGAFTPSAFCQARARLPVELLRCLLESLAARVRADDDQSKSGRWRGRRVFLADGSGCSMPDTPLLQEAFGQPSNQQEGCGFPVTHVLPLVDAHTGTLMGLHIGPLRTNDMPTIRGLHGLLEKGDVLVGDRAFCAYSHLCDLVAAGLDGAFRLHQSRSTRFASRRHRRRLRTSDSGWHGGATLVERLGKDDRIVEWTKPRNRRPWMSQEYFAALPATLRVRLVRVRVRGRGARARVIVIATTLLDARAYPAAEIARLYQLRWRIETDLKHLKHALGMDHLRCTTPDGVRRELYTLALMYNLVRMVMGAAAERQGVNPERISFIDALRWLRCASPGEDLCPLVVNPQRDGRSEPRVRKRRGRSYPNMCHPRAHYKKRRRKSAALI